VLASGKGLNCARAAMRLGANPQALLILGGEPGRWVQTTAAGEGIQVTAVESLTPTRTCITLINRQSGEATEIVENSGPAGPDAAKRFEELFIEQIPGCAACILTGTLPPDMAPDLYARLADAAQSARAPVIMDAQGTALLAALQTAPLLVKPNRAELGAALGIDCRSGDNLATALARMHALGARNVLVSDGASAAAFSDGRFVTMIKPPPVAPGNPIGSGDSLAAGIAVALADGLSLTAAVCHGIACASANATGEGYGRIDPGAVQELLARM
jgi:tagatose 6-phosphate kinase